MSQRATSAAVSEPTPAPGSMRRQPASVGSGAIEAAKLAEARGVKNCPQPARALGSRIALVLERRCSTLAKNSSTEDTPTVSQSDRPILWIRLYQLQPGSPGGSDRLLNAPCGTRTRPTGLK